MGCPERGSRKLARPSAAWVVCCAVLGASTAGSWTPEAWAQASQPAEGNPTPVGAVPATDGATDRTVEPVEERFGASMRVVLPIEARTLERLKRFVRRAIQGAERDAARPVLIFEFHVPQDAEEHGRGTDFALAYGAADYLSGPELSGATTVAFLPKTIQGHAVLVALACDEIVMAPDAELGPAGLDDPMIDETRLSAYRTIAARRRTVPPPIALGLLDPSLEVLRVETDLGREYVTSDGLDELKQTRSIDSTEVLFPGGEAGRLTGREARSLGLIGYLATDRREVADALGLPIGSLLPDPSAGGNWRAARFELRGPLDRDDVGRVQRLIDEQIRRNDLNFVLLWIDSPGGAPEGAMGLANYLAELNPDQVRTVAYIPGEARGDAALVALGCDQIVLLPDALLGGSGAHAFEEREVQQVRRSIAESLAPEKGRSWSLWAAIVDPGLEVFECQRLNLTEYFSEAELQEQGQPDKWEKGRRVTQPGEVFSARGAEAVDYNMATRVVDSYAELKREFGLENDPALVEPSWADELIELLASPGVTVLLLMLGGFGIYFELNSPGVGIGGFVALVCFTIFFWASYLGGTAGLLEALLFLLGVTCILLEIFVLPGFGVFGFGGGVLVVTSVVLATQTFVVPHNEYQLQRFQQSILSVAAAAVGVGAAAVLLRRWLPHTPMLSGVVLAPPGMSEEDLPTTAGDETAGDTGGADGTTRHELTVGARGMTVTQLTPSGKARFGSRTVDVLTDGELVARGAEIEVIEVHANRVIVRPV